ncbi:MAG: septal ring lytic transglycosylase RlpA family protein [Nitrospirae bacterium]|nr:septal ring lytic transglycosylase RlpA family protein [Nitrospirota bacterium]
MPREWIINQANMRWGLNKKKKVGAVSEEIRRCSPKSLVEWEGYYYTSTKYLLIILLTILLASCASVPPPEYRRPPKEGYITASWYGQDFHGRPTSSGERYDMYGMTCAHKTMDFGTKLRVTNPDTDQSVDVIVNDRGPFIDGRDLDLSYGAAREIGFANKGVGEVKIEYLGRDMRYAKRLPFEPVAASGGLTIQLGAFIEQSNAERLKKGLEFKYDNVFITTAFVNGQKFFRVRLGEFKDYNNAYSVAAKLADEGYTTFVTAKN